MSDKAGFVKETKQRYFIHSLAKGLAVLQTFSEIGRPVSLTEIAKALNVNKTTATRLCLTLSELGFLIRDKQRRFHVTPRVLTLGVSCILSLNWRQAAESSLRHLFEEIQETVTLTLLDGANILYVIRIREPAFLPADIRLGTKVPVHCTAAGKLLMAMGPPNRTKPILDHIELRPVTHRTITNLQTFKAELEVIRKRGYALTEEEFALGTRGLAVPILNSEGVSAAAINVSVLTTRYTQEELVDKLLQPLLKTAHEISETWQQLEYAGGVKEYVLSTDR
jgi:IclR family pca regulon transcriptional regulator